MSTVSKFKAGYIKVLVHKIDADRFEVIDWESFSLNFTQEYSSLDEEIGTLGIEYILGDQASIFPELKEGCAGEVIAAVNIEYTKSWSDCGYEYDVYFDLQEIKTKVYSVEESHSILNDPSEGEEA